MRCCPPAPANPDAILSKGPIDFLVVAFVTVCLHIVYLSIYFMIWFFQLKCKPPGKQRPCPSCSWKHGYRFTHSASPSTHAGVQAKSLCCCQSSQLWKWHGQVHCKQQRCWWGSIRQCDNDFLKRLADMAGARLPCWGVLASPACRSQWVSLRMGLETRWDKACFREAP